MFGVGPLHHSGLTKARADGLYMPGGVRGGSALAAPYSITADDTWEDTGLNVVLPSAGTYLVIFTVSGFTYTSDADAYISARLFNSTDSAVITDSEIIVAYNIGTLYSVTTATGSTFVTTAGASKTIRVEAKRTGGVTYVNSDILSQADGKTSMCYLKVG